MKNISVVMIQRGLTKLSYSRLLHSFTNGHTQVEKVYVISWHNHYKGLNSFNREIGVDYVYAEGGEQNIGTAINRLMPFITSEYVVFLFADEILVDPLPDLTKYLDEKQSVLSLTPEIQGISYSRPFLVKTTRLRSGPFFYAADQVPFPASILPTWLAQIDRTEVVDLPVKVIQETRQNLRMNDRYIHEVLAFFQPKSTSGTGERFNPSVTILLSTYNMGHYLETALGSLVTQNEQPDQILLVDDGSFDNTQEKLKKWLNLCGLTAMQIENVGKAKALNHLLPLITSDFVLELDADDWLDPNALAVIRKHLRILPAETCLLYGNLRMWKQHTSGELWCRGVQHGQSISHMDQLLQIKLPLGPRIYRTTALREIGGFPVVNFAEGRLYEDVLVVKKLMEQSPILYQDFTVYNVREHPTSITKRNLSKWREFENKWHQHFEETEDH